MFKTEFWIKALKVFWFKIDQKYMESWIKNILNCDRLKFEGGDNSKLNFFNIGIKN